MTRTRAKSKEKVSDKGAEDSDLSYRSCTVFIWLDRAPRAPDWWVDQSTASGTGKGSRSTPRCPGLRCGDLRKRDGNRQCSNGGLCKECCDIYQKGGFLPKCDHVPHNYQRKLEEVSTPDADEDEALTAAPTSQGITASNLPYSPARRSHAKDRSGIVLLSRNNSHKLNLAIPRIWGIQVQKSG